MVFFGNESLAISAGLQKLINDKKSTLKFKLDKVVSQALNDLRIGEAKLEFDGDKVQNQII